MKPPGHTRAPGYAAQVQLSLLGLAVPAVVLAALGWSLLSQSQYRVERGRIASDIYTALLVFDIEKAGLRNWSYQRALQGPGDAGFRQLRLAGMQEQITRIARKADIAAGLDRQRGKVLEEHAVRLALLAFLKDVVAALDLETRLLLGKGGADTEKIDADFEQLDGVPMAAALRDALATEAAALERERARADQSLAAARGLFATAGGLGLGATFLLALIMARRLRQPLQQLDTGLRAYQAGDFSFRFDHFRDREFVKLGQQLNAMATEVDLARSRAAQNRIGLEQTVAARTAELRKTLEELAMSESARQRLLADVGHELRTPVTVIRGEAQVALRMKAPGTAAYRAALERIVSVSRQMGHLIEDLLVLVRDPDSRPPVTLRRMSLARSITPALEIAQSIAAQQGVALQGPDTLPGIDVIADPDRLRQILTCLLDNALRYSRGGGVVTLKVDQTPTDASIRISDDGIGIDARDLDRVFDRGWRSDAARMHRPDGLGLGLAIARDLAQAQGGRLEIGPGPEGRGTVATLHLPLAQKGGADGYPAD